MPSVHLALFQGRQVRKVLHDDVWFFSVQDVVGILAESADPRQYIKKLRSRDPSLDSNWGTICTPLPLVAPDGKVRSTHCANAQGLFRIIQSIPSPKAEPFKAWLAQVGAERIQASAPAICTRPRGTPRTGSRSACAPSPSARN